MEINENDVQTSGVINENSIVATVSSRSDVNRFGKHVNINPEENQSSEDYKELDQMDMFSMVSSPKKLPSRLVGKDYVVFDLETTGLDYSNNEILEIGAVKIRNGEIIETFNTLIKPMKVEISDFITDLTGISNEMVKDAPTIKELFPKILEFLGNTKDTVIVAHNANFDVGFLKQNANDATFALVDNARKCFSHLFLRLNWH